MTEPIEVAAPRTPEWYAARRTSFGASQAYAVIERPLEVYCEVKGLTRPMEDNLFLKRGRALEPILIDEFERLTGIEVVARSMPMYRHPEFRYVSATPDADLANGELLEAKTATRFSQKCRQLGTEETDEVPED